MWFQLSVLLLISSTVSSASSTHHSQIDHTISINQTNSTSLYIYYNDSIDFLHVNLGSFTHQLKLSLAYALTSTIGDAQPSNTNSISICSFYQHQLSASYFTNECKQSAEWELSQKQLTIHGAQSALSIKLDIDTFDPVMDSIHHNKSAFTQYLEECMNKDRNVPFCRNKNQLTGRFMIISIDNELQTKKDVISPSSTHNVMMWLTQIGLYLYDYSIYCMMAICVITASIAWLHALWNRYDCVNIAAVIIYGIYVWDFYADVIFGTHLLMEGHLWLAIASASCVALPLMTQIGALLIYEEQWISDKLLREKITGWLMMWSRRLLLIAFVSGSTYGAVELLNSNIFGMAFFSMGLTKKHLAQFSSKRLLTTVLFENIPQLIIQCFYIIQYKDYHYLLEHYHDIRSMDIVLFTAVMSSLVSIFTTFISLCATRNTLKMRSKDQYIFWMFIAANAEIDNKINQCIYRRKALAKGLESILKVNTIEIALCYQATEGIMVAFNVYADKLDRNKRLQAKLIHELNAAANFGGKLEKMIQSVWKLSDIPLVTVITKSGCISEIECPSDICIYDKPRITNRHSSTLTIDLANFIIDELNGTPVTPHLAPLSPGTASKCSDFTMVPILLPQPLQPVRSATSHTPSSYAGYGYDVYTTDGIAHRESIDVDPYAL